MTRGRLASVLAVGVIVVAAWLVAPGLTARGPREDLPPELQGRVNPRAHEPAAVAEGAALFEGNCATCHGAAADGRGEAAPGLNPPPANLRDGDVLRQHSDAYLYYRLGVGKPGTAMPSFHGALDERERWAIIAFLRTLRPVTATP